MKTKGVWLVSHPVYRRPRREASDGESEKYRARARARATPAATRTRIPDIRRAHARVHVIRSAVATSRDIGEYMPAAADLLLVVNLANHFWSPRLNSGLSAGKAGPYVAKARAGRDPP